MRLHEKVNKEILPALSKETGLNILSLPKITKAVVTVGLGPFRERKDVLEAIEKELTQITGQKPKTNIAKKSISGFKLREGQVIGYQVTLRGQRMWDFIERLNSVVLPRLRDFEGINPKSFDEAGNLTVAVKEQAIFPEIKHDEIKESWGLGVTLTMNKPQDTELAKKFLTQIGFIFK
jgi:large subunit ribosomal protein L5